MSGSQLEWSSTARIHADRLLSVACADTLLYEEEPGDSGRITPVDVLVAAIAACFAMSCDVVMRARGLNPRCIVAAVAGRKLTGRDKRLGEVAIRVSFRDPLSERELERVLSDAKRLCTVTNSLSEQVLLNVQGFIDGGETS